MAKNATLHDVASATGVSPRTVSRVVNNEPGFSDATRSRVLAAIDELGYRPNMAARSLITRRTQTIGLVVFYLTDPYFPELADGVERSARDHKHTMLLSTHDGDPQTQAEILDSLASHGVDAAIVFPSTGGDDGLRRAADGGLPIVVIDKEISYPGIASVSSDILEGARLAVDHLLAKGHRRIAMVASTLSEGRRREQGYTEALEAAAIPLDENLLVRCPPTIEGALEATPLLLEADPKLTAIFAYNDLMAIGVIAALQKTGRRIPEDVAVVGFDDIPFTAFVTPPITTVRLDRELVGSEAVRMAMTLAENPKLEVAPIVLPVTLVERASS